MEKLTKREKIVLGVAVASVAAAGYLGYKNTKDVNMLKQACSEGLFEEAITTVCRKLNRRKDILESLSSKQNKTTADLEKIKKLKREIGMFEVRKANFIKAQTSVGIR